ncbi:metallophosphoesterase family protein [Paenibacillus alginolyticus]|uniref:metallophosphoesterase family protein n=1 Tax=Paenibacillus alginolyticus TaxID=59839 RepID=UPI00041E3213|nr:metallophosphoesterase family protein [Paenibacillus alginolyticus]MCY9663906.1 metallophosphoesterase family protein [Paenibacillus alginolyticus]
MKKRLKFRDDGTFVIVQFSDVEFLDEFDYDPETPKYDSQTRALMERIIEAEKPDLIVFAGDVIASNRARDPIHSFRQAVDVAEMSCIPWAAVFGNHDSEGEVPRKTMHELQLQHEYCVAEPDPEGVNGAGNFVVTVAGKNDDTAAALYFVDSGDYSLIGDRVGGYDWIRRDQIDWYVGKSRELTRGSDDQPLPALAFFHIPLPEYNDVWDFQVCYGHRYDSCCSTPSINSGMFAAMVEIGDVMGTFVGHDHGNDFWGTLHGIRLCYGRSTRYVSYVDGVRHDLVPTGARIIRLIEGERRFDTWIRQNDGTVVVEQPEHRPEGRKAQ